MFTLTGALGRSVMRARVLLYGLAVVSVIISIAAAATWLLPDVFPVITFTTTHVEPDGQDRYIVTGDLTIKGNTRSVALQMSRLGEFNDPRMGHRIGYSGTAKINRKDFGLTWNTALETGGILVGDEVTITLEVQAVKE